MDELIVAFDQLDLFGMEIPIVASIPMDSPVVAFFARLPCSPSWIFENHDGTGRRRLRVRS